MFTLSSIRLEQIKPQVLITVHADVTFTEKAKTAKEFWQQVKHKKAMSGRLPPKREYLKALESWQKEPQFLNPPYHTDGTEKLTGCLLKEGLGVIPHLIDCRFVQIR